jgi:hypothetical protein
MLPNSVGMVPLNCGQDTMNNPSSEEIAPSSVYRSIRIIRKHSYRNTTSQLIILSHCENEDREDRRQLEQRLGRQLERFSNACNANTVHLTVKLIQTEDIRCQ